MIHNSEFDDIRPYYDEEVSEVIERLLADERFRKTIELVLPGMNWEQFSAQMYSFKNVRDFQFGIIKDMVYKIVGNSAKSIELEGSENILPGEAYTYISNHRDIVLDAALLCVMLADKGADTVEIAIGDNLLSHPWIEDVVRLNKSFIVKRGVTGRQVLENSVHLSKYIHYTVEEKNQSVWIAQREGRAKNSDDHTQESVLKMLLIGGDGSVLKRFLGLNICPVSLSYEYDPCDYLKAKEFQQKRDIPDFKKTREDDLLSMETGIFGYKGNIHFQLGKPINGILNDLNPDLPKNEIVTQVASLVDKEIFLNYSFFPINYIAFDRLEKNNSFREFYTQNDLADFDKYLQKQLDRIDLPNKDIPFLTERILEMYANPLRNNLKAKNGL